MVKNYRNTSKVARSPKRPFEKERLESELKLVGEYGLKNKREVWRTQLVLAKIRKAARTLLTLEPTDAKRIFEGTALLRRLTRLGCLTADEQKLDYVLGLTIQKLLERRLQTRVFKLAHAKSVHHARVLIKQGHICVAGQKVTAPSFMVRIDSEKSIDFNPKSPYGGGRLGRVARKKLATGKNNDEE